MLKLFILFFLVIFCVKGWTSDFKDSVVVYDLNVEPTCYIKLNEDYWRWRDEVGLSKDLRKDVANALRGLDLFDSLGNGISYDKLKSGLCAKEFIFSEEVNIAMNFFSKDILPYDLYFFTINRFYGQSFVSTDDLIQALIDGMVELDKRLKD
ncbi:hypothetical protein AYJ58_17765 [Shewanella sp. Pdp11]|jgi:hypothetical protein|uniref:hypothetical protein n=1 Tax=Shewanella sp. Pdp11 TaxID=2059264 RepID=UPI000CA12EF8|nr:hypothetical protein [Shewanella sp. Pdp11]AUD61209.1 hypothetical protein AYJ58_17765 [Shewanella sp. Pdp11]